MTAAVMDDRLFVDGVMARIANEPLPTPARALRTAVATLDAGLGAGATWTAWHLATSRNTHVRRGMRIRSALLVALLMTLLTIGTTLAAAGATIVVRQFVEDHFVPQSVTNRGQNGPDNNGLPVIVPPTSSPDARPIGDDSSDGPDEDATEDPDDDDGGAPGRDDTEEPGDDNVSDDDSGGHDGDESGGDQDSSGGDDVDSSDSSDEDDADTGDQDSSDGQSSGDEDSPEPTDEADANDGGQGEAAESTESPDDNSPDGGASPDDGASSDEDAPSDDGGVDQEGGNED